MTVLRYRLVPILANRMLLNLRAYSRNGAQVLKGPAALQAFNPAQTTPPWRQSFVDSYELSPNEHSGTPFPYQYHYAKRSSLI